VKPVTVRENKRSLPLWWFWPGSDRKATKEQGAPVYKICERCSGNGFSTMPSTAAYKAILTLIPDLHIRTWTRNWKPFCDALVDLCWRKRRGQMKSFNEQQLIE
jgi:hypothetical protein